MRESQIIEQTGPCWVADANGQYTVYQDGATTAMFDSSYARTADGLSLAIARSRYLGRRAQAAMLRSWGVNDPQNGAQC